MTSLRNMPPAMPVQLGAPRTVQAGLPGLDRVGERLARVLTDAFSASGATASRGDVRTVSLGDWKAGLGGSAAVARYRARTIKGGMMLSAPPQLITALVDRFYGGSGTVEDARGPLGMAERRFFERLAERLVAGIGAAWAEILPVEAMMTGCAFVREDVAFAKDDARVVVQPFSLGQGATIEFIYPLAALRGIAGLSNADGNDEAVEIDTAWATRMADAVMQTRLPVRTVLARPTLPLSRLLSLVPGDIIPVTLPARVPVTVAGRLMAHGTIGEANGRAAIKIDNIEQGFLTHG